jgi:hypothetical protein
MDMSVFTYHDFIVIPSKKLTIGYHEFYWQEFEYNKGVIRIRKSKKDRKHNDQKKKDKRPNNDLQREPCWFEYQRVNK